MPFMEIRLFSMEGFPLKQAKNKKELYVVNENYFIFFVFCLSNRARQNRAFGKRYLERGDCLSRSRAEHRRGEFLRVTSSALPCFLSRKKRGNRGSSKQCRGTAEPRRRSVIAVHGEILLANGGVSP